MLLPEFRRKQDGSLVLSDTTEASIVIKENRKKQRLPAKTPTSVRNHATARLVQLGGDDTDQRQRMGQLTVQFGQYRDQPFVWLLSNALGYAAFIAHSSKNETGGMHDNLWINKMALLKYMSLFPEAEEAIIQKSAEQQKPPRSKTVTQDELMPDADDQELLAAVQDIEMSRAVTSASQTTPVSIPCYSAPQSTTVTPCKTSEGSPPGMSTEKTVTLSQSLLTSAKPKTTMRGLRTVSGAPKFALKGLMFSGRVQSKPRLELSPAVPVAQEEQTEQRSTPVRKPQYNVTSREASPATSTSGSSQVTTSLTQNQMQSVSSASEVPLMEKWRKQLPPIDQMWIGKELFFWDHLGTGRMDFDKITKLWWYPPEAPIHPHSSPKLENFFGRRLFMWMPVKLFNAAVPCPHPGCTGQLVYAGIYPVVRKVIDISNLYYLASETLNCKVCRRKSVSWSHSVLSNLDVALSSLFPCILTTMKACDRKVTVLLRQRGLGNSSSQVAKKLHEQHVTEWYTQVIRYLTACKVWKGSAFTISTSFPEPPQLLAIPSYHWFMQVYIQDVLQRLDELKASLTSVYGRILKMDSTKKITKKLAGPIAGTAEWATSVGNEVGQILMCVITAGEGRYGLHRMAQGLMARYRDANWAPPLAFYIDRDCCGPNKVHNLFSEWEGQTAFRLDIWHFMRRLTSACHSESHPLYALFTQRLSQAIFVWDQGDLEALKAAKRSQLALQKITDPPEALVMETISRNDLALYCRRTTRGVEETTRLIEDLIDAFDGEKGNDALGTPLMNSKRMREEWASQKRHVACLQDPPHVQLYISTGKTSIAGHPLTTYEG